MHTSLYSYTLCTYLSTMEMANKIKIIKINILHEKRRRIPTATFSVIVRFLFTEDESTVWRCLFFSKNNNEKKKKRQRQQQRTRIFKHISIDDIKANCVRSLSKLLSKHIYDGAQAHQTTGVIHMDVQCGYALHSMKSERKREPFLRVLIAVSSIADVHRALIAFAPFQRNLW